MKQVRRGRDRWRPPAPLLPAAVFHCRRCRAPLTVPLGLLGDAAAVSQQEGTSRVPPGHYWPVPAGQDFAGTLAVALADLIEVGYHNDTRRRQGCCGPSGSNGRNRVCRCGQEIGTEQSDCLWPQAVYLDLAQVYAAAPGAESDAAAGRSES